MSDVFGVLALAVFGAAVLTVVGIVFGMPDEEPAAGQESRPRGCEHREGDGDDPAVCDCRKV